MSDPNAVWAAIDEYDRIGSHAFHEKYRFGPADVYLVRARGRLYDSKAILAAAQGYENPALQAATNDFSGGGQVRRRLQRLGFEVLLDRRCGDFLKLIARIRTARGDNSQRVYKPLLLLCALGRAAHQDARLLPFKSYEEELEPLLLRFADGHGDAAVANAWWRVPGDGLWEVVSDSGAVVRRAGERAASGLPSSGDLHTQVGGFPENFYNALLEVSELGATAANLLVDRYFPNAGSGDHEFLLELAGADHESRNAGQEDIHLIVKWRKSYEPATIAKHQEVVERQGAVWWAIFNQSEEQKVGREWLDHVRANLRLAA